MNIHIGRLARDLDTIPRSYSVSTNIRGVTNTPGGEYGTHHEYKATNTTIYSGMQSI